MTTQNYSEESIQNWFVETVFPGEAGEQINELVEKNEYIEVRYQPTDTDSDGWWFPHNWSEVDNGLHWLWVSPTDDEKDLYLILTPVNSELSDEHLVRYWVQVVDDRAWVVDSPEQIQASIDKYVQSYLDILEERKESLLDLKQEYQKLAIEHPEYFEEGWSELVDDLSTRDHLEDTIFICADEFKEYRQEHM